MSKWESEFTDEAEGGKPAAKPCHEDEPMGVSQVAAEWAMLDYWTIDEAACLLCLCNPTPFPALPKHTTVGRQVHGMRVALLRSRLAADAADGRHSLVDAKSVCRWADSKNIPLPTPLKRQFLADADQSATDKKSSPPHGNAVLYGNQRMAVLQAAVAVLSRYHHQCLDTHGRVVPKKLARTIVAEQAKLFHGGEAPQTEDQMARHLGAACKLWPDRH